MIHVILLHHQPLNEPNGAVFTTFPTRPEDILIVQDKLGQYAYKGNTTLRMWTEETILPENWIMG